MSTNNNGTPANKKVVSEVPGGLLVTLRRMAPVRRLQYWEHLTLAERQATRLHVLLGQTSPGVDMAWLVNGTVDIIDVVMEPAWRMDDLAGMSTWNNGRWVIGINKGDPQARRRFTLAHEFKHVLDAQTDKVTYQGISSEQRERIADYFAACYLMPKLLLRRAWTRGVQDPEALAGLFKVSLQAMRARLKHLQYLDDQLDRPVASYFRVCSDTLADKVVAADRARAALV